MLLTDKVLLDLLSLELPDTLSSRLFPPICCACWLFLSSFLSLSPEFLSPSCYCNEVPCSVADSVVNIILVEVLTALLVPLPLFHGVCG